MIIAVLNVAPIKSFRLAWFASCSFAMDITSSSSCFIFFADLVCFLWLLPAPLSLVDSSSSGHQLCQLPSSCSDSSPSSAFSAFGVSFGFLELGGAAVPLLVFPSAKAQLAIADRDGENELRLLRKAPCDVPLEPR